VEETGVPGDNHHPATNHWQTLSHNVALSRPRYERGVRRNYICVCGSYFLPFSQIDTCNCKLINSCNNGGSMINMSSTNLSTPLPHAQHVIICIQCLVMIEILVTVMCVLQYIHFLSYIMEESLYWWSKLEYLEKKPQICCKSHYHIKLYWVHLIIGWHWNHNLSDDKDGLHR
jgi:hypothetical protein